MQIKHIVRYHLLPIQLAKIQSKRHYFIEAGGKRILPHISIGTAHLYDPSGNQCGKISQNLR